MHLPAYRWYPIRKWGCAMFIWGNLGVSKRKTIFTVPVAERRQRSVAPSAMRDVLVAASRKEARADAGTV